MYTITIPSKEKRNVPHTKKKKLVWAALLLYTAASTEATRLYVYSVVQ